MMDNVNEASADNILNLLRTMYWKGVRREVCEAILAYHKIEQLHPGLSVYEKDTRNSNLSGINFKKFCALLTPYVQNNNDFDSDKIHKQALERAGAHLSINIEERRARYLLQAIGLLDIDVVHDSMDDTTIGRHNHNPQGERLSLSNGTVIFREMKCQGCKWPLRGYFYYECKEGCLSITSSPANQPYIEDCKGNRIESDQFPEELRHEIFQAPKRLCPSCIGDTKLFQACKRAHYEKIYPARRVKGLATFESRLRTQEFERKKEEEGSYQPGLTQALYKIAPPTHYADAGPIHFALMFGPLMIENGVPNSMGGAHISCRPVPSLRFQSPSLQLISIEEDAKADSQDKSFVGYIYDHKDSNKRLLKERYDTRKKRRFLGCAKRVMGGAFSGHEEIFMEGEHAIITRFIKAKNGYSSRMNMGISDSVRYRRAVLQKLAQPVIDAINETFAHEIDFYLKHFADVLQNTENDLKWNLKTNNCQSFYKMLLKDLSITLFLHRVPKGFLDNQDLRREKVWPYPRYCLSFGPDIDTPMALLRPQPRSIIWNFYHRKRDYCDIIEFGERFRIKLCEIPTESWEVLDSIDDGDVQSITLVDALWSIPRDSFSILQTHLLRNSSRYSTKDGKALSEVQWYENRLRIFHQLDVFASLSGGLVRSLMDELIEKKHLLPKAIFMNATTFGTLHATEKIRTPKVFGYDLPFAQFLSGRERNWHKRAIEHNFRKFREKVS